METILVLGNWLLPLLYLALLIGYGESFFLRTKARARNGWLVPVIVFHALFLAGRGLALGRLPMVSVYEVLSLLVQLHARQYTNQAAIRGASAMIFVTDLLDQLKGWATWFHSSMNCSTFAWRSALDSKSAIRKRFRWMMENHCSA